MKVKDLRVYRYTLALTRPVTVRGKALQKRTGFLLHLRDETGREGWGESAPLPGASREDTGATLEQLRYLCDRLPGTSLPDESALTPSHPQLLSDQELLSSVRTGLEWAHATALPLTASTGGATKTVKVNGLLSGSCDEVCAQAAKRVKDGFECLKLKVGSGEPERDAAVVRAVREQVGAGVALRLDANRTWSLPDGMTFARLVADCDLEYIEEPLTNMADLSRFAAESNIPVALDETVQDTPAAAWLSWDFVTAVVLKPSIVGGLSHAADLIGRAQARGMTPVLSAVYESGIGLSALGHLAMASGLEQTCHGLDTYQWLGEDVLATRIDMTTGRVDIDAMFPQNRAINSERLERMI